MRLLTSLHTLSPAAICLLTFVAVTVGCAKDETTEPDSATVASEEETTASALPVALDPAELPDITGRLNGREVPRQELVDYADGLRQRLAQNGADPGIATAEFYRTALDQLMNGELLFAEAVARGFEATSAEVDVQLNGMKAQFPSPEAFTAALAAQGLTEEEAAHDVRRGLSVQKFIDAEVAAQVELAPDAGRNYYDANLNQMQQPEQVHVQHILVLADQQASAEDRTKARQKAESILQRASDGEDFATLARDNSEDTGSAQRGGDLSWISPGQTVPPFEAAAFALQPGELSGVVESQFGYHIIRAEERRDASVLPFEQVSPQIRQMLVRQALEDEVDRRIETLRSAAKIEVLL
jgi:peptidyl-prolyl cis-trans isomerase C